jgi:hypothetical protein
VGSLALAQDLARARAIVLANDLTLVHDRARAFTYDRARDLTLALALARDRARVLAGDLVLTRASALFEDIQRIIKIAEAVMGPQHPEVVAYAEAVETFNRRLSETEHQEPDQ